MYKRKLFESADAMLKWLNASNISPSDIISIMPFQMQGLLEKDQLRQEYELIYTAGRFQNIERQTRSNGVNGEMLNCRELGVELELHRKESAQAAVLITNLRKDLANEKVLREAAERRERALRERSWWERLIRKGE